VRKVLPFPVDERENFVTSEVDRRACALHKSIMAVNGKDSIIVGHLSVSLCSEFGEDRLTRSSATAEKQRVSCPHGGG